MTDTLKREKLSNEELRNLLKLFEINADEITVEALSTPDYPLQKKRHSVEFLREQAYLRPRTKRFSAVFRVRSEVAYAICNLTLLFLLQTFPAVIQLEYFVTNIILFGMLILNLLIHFLLKLYHFPWIV